MTKHKHGQPSQRQLRVGELVRQTLSDMFMRGEVNDPVLDGKIITVAEVRMSPDLKNATAFVTPLGGGDATVLVEALNRNRKFLRGQIAKRIDLRFSPDIRFEADKRFEEDMKIDRLLHSPDVARDLKKPSEF
jgi:ribosome-binding factor A